MTAVLLQPVMDDVLSALLTMNALEMERAESRLSELPDLQPDAEVIAKLRQLRAAAVNASRLWRFLLSEPDIVIYSPAGECTPVANESGMSITA